MVGMVGSDYFFLEYICIIIYYLWRSDRKWGQRLPKHTAQLRAWAPVSTDLAVETAISSDLKPREDNKDN